MADFDRTASIRRLTGTAFDRVVFDADLHDHQPQTIACGVIFVHAFWAGSSVQSLAEFCKSIARVDTQRLLLFVVCDIDSILERDPSLYQSDGSGGNGDVFWISNGRVVARHTASRSCDFDTANRSLLQWCGENRQDAAPTSADTENG